MDEPQQWGYEFIRRERDSCANEDVDVDDDVP